MEIDFVKTGNLLKKYREHSGMTITDLHKKLFITYPAVKKWEDGKAIPSIDNLVKLSDLYQCTIDDLIVRK